MKMKSLSICFSKQSAGKTKLTLAKTWNIDAKPVLDKIKFIFFKFFKNK